MTKWLFKVVISLRTVRIDPTFLTLINAEREGLGYVDICLSVCLSVC